MSLTLKYIVHYREAPESPQWEKECATKEEADRFAYNIFLNGGITVVVETEAEDIFVDPVTERLKEEDNGN